VIAPHTSTYEVWLPDVLHQWTDTIDICDVWTLYLVFTHEALTRPRALHLLSTTPNEAVVLSVVADVTSCLGAPQSSRVD
jgi:hypothetical protein